MITFIIYINSLRLSDLNKGKLIYSRNCGLTYCNTVSDVLILITLLKSSNFANLFTGKICEILSAFGVVRFVSLATCFPPPAVKKQLQDYKIHPYYS